MTATRNAYEISNFDCDMTDTRKLIIRADAALASAGDVSGAAQIRY
jgi:hypothetical protein